MNSSIGLNETNLINFNKDLVTEDDINAEDDLFTFPFDHMYACQTETLDISKPLYRTKDLTPQPGTSVYVGNNVIRDNSKNDRVSALSAELNSVKTENKHLKELTLLHLELIQQQSEQLLKKEKQLLAFKKQCETIIKQEPPVIKQQTFGTTLPTTNYKYQAFLQIPAAPQASVVKPILKSQDIEHSTMTGSRSTISGLYKNGTYNNSGLFSQTKIMTNNTKATIGDSTNRNIIFNSRKKKPVYGYNTKPAKIRSVKRTKFEKIRNSIPITKAPSIIDNDPYNLDEIEMRENSPIPRLTVLHPNQSKVKHSMSDEFCTNKVNNFFDNSVIGTDSPDDPMRKIKLHNSEIGSCVLSKNTKEEEFFNNRNDTKLDYFTMKWDDFEIRKEDTNVIEPSCSDFSYGENQNNLALNSFKKKYLNLYIENNALDYLSLEKLDDNLNISSKSRKQRPRTNSLVDYQGSIQDYNGKVRRKRALSNCSSQTAQNFMFDDKEILCDAFVKDNSISQPFEKKEAPPGLMVEEPYYTTLGDNDSTWYSNQEAEYDGDDLDNTLLLHTNETLEVPRWREKSFASSFSAEGTENLDDSVFNKRHCKQEIDERRRKRWDIQRIREQRHIERLKRRQRDTSWYNFTNTMNSLNTNNDTSDNDVYVYTFSPQPFRDIQSIEITDEVPVTAFGEVVPALPEHEFVLPWVRVSKPSKKSRHSSLLKKLKKTICNK